MTEAVSASGKSKRIVLTTFGSLGDLHPYIALALGLQARGHEAVIATSPFYRPKIEALGIGLPTRSSRQARPGRRPGVGAAHHGPSPRHRLRHP